MNRRHAAGVWLLGTAAGVVGNQALVRTGALRYAHPALFGQAWWVFALAGCGAVVLAVVHGRLRPSPGPDRTARLRPAWSLAWVLGGFIAAGLFRHESYALAVFFVSTAAGRVLLREGAEARGLWRWTALVAVAGCACEGALGAVGAAAYRHPELGEVPVWLPGLYLHAGLCAADVARRWPIEDRAGA